MKGTIYMLVGLICAFGFSLIATVLIQLFLRWLARHEPLDAAAYTDWLIDYNAAEYRKEKLIDRCMAWLTIHGKLEDHYIEIEWDFRPDVIVASWKNHVVRIPVEELP